MRRIVIIGAGAHGREVAEILISNREHVIGFIDDDPRLRDRTINDLPVLGDWRWFESQDTSSLSVICASGFSETRKQMVQRALELQLKFANAISPMAYVSATANLGDGIVIYPNAVVGCGASVGSHTVINAGAIVSHDVVIG